MRITRIAVGGFGQFNGAHLEPAAGLTVIRGPNEAGKTTLLAFTRAMLFGFESGRYPALSGGKRGGWLDVEMQDGRTFRIERYGERGGGGSLRVVDGEGNDLGAGYLPTLLQGVESKVYRNIFAFGLEELTQFERLTDSEVAARIYGAGLGTGSVSGLDVENALRNERDALFKPGGQRPTINLLLHALEEVDGQLRDRDLPREYGEAGARLVRVEEEVAEVNRRHAELDAERRRQQRLIDGWTAWLERSRAMTEREALGDVRAFETAVLEQLGRLETTLADSARGADLAAKARDLAQEALDSAEVDAAALERRSELEALAEATKIELAQQKERARTDRELTEAQGRVDAAVTKLGADWSVERIESFDDSIAVQAEISGRFRTLLEGSDQAVASARRDLDTATTSLEETTRQAEAAAQRVAGLETELGDRPPWATRERALREIESLGERLASQRRIAADVPDGDLAATRTALEARSAQARELATAVESERTVREVLASATETVEAASQRPWEPLLPPIMLAVGGLVVAVVLALADVSVLVAGVVAVAAVGGAVGWAYLLRQTGPSAAEDARARLQQQLDEATAIVRRDGAALGLGEQPSPTEVDRLIVALEEERRTLERDEDRQARAEAAAREAERLEAELETAATAVGLPGEPGPVELEAFGRQLASDRETDARRAGLQERVAELRSTAESQEQRRDELAAVLEQRTEEAARAREAWQDWLEQHDLDRAYDRETASRVVESVASAKATVGALRTLEVRSEALRVDHAAYIEQVKALAPLLPDGQLDEADLAGATALLAKRLSDALEGERARSDLARSARGAGGRADAGPGGAGIGCGGARGVPR